MNVNAKEIKQHIARAKAYAERREVIKSLLSLSQAVKFLALSKVVGREKIEIEVLLGEAMKGINKLEAVKRFSPSGLVYLKGQEKRLFVNLADLIKKMREAAEQEQMDTMRARKNRIDQLVLKAQTLFDEKQFLEGKKVLRMVAEQFADEPGLNVDLGARMFKAGLHTECVEYLSRAIETNPKDSRPYIILTNAYEALGSYDEAEALLRDAVKWFGTSPKLYVRLARIYKERRKWSEAYEMAKTAEGLDPNLADAKQLIEEIEPRIFGGTRARG